jgi:hypothetical protein
MLDYGDCGRDGRWHRRLRHTGYRAVEQQGRQARRIWLGTGTGALIRDHRPNGDVDIRDLVARDPY